MAPRPTNKKKGNLRIDAALDAMRPYGFPSKLVRSTVKELLSVYGGDDGWVFIEDGAYTLLIDTILEKINDCAIEKLEDGEAEDHPETLEAGCSSSCLSNPSLYKPEAEGAIKQSCDNSNSAFVTDHALDPKLLTYGSEETCHGNYKDSGDDDCFRSTFKQQSESTTVLPIISRRRSYHGWISNDAADEEDLVNLEAAPLPEELAKLLRVHEKGKGKIRWDVKPGNF